MTRLDSFLEFAEGHKRTVWATSAAMIAMIAWSDAVLPTISIGFLYLIPILISAAALNTAQIIAVAAVCGFLREAFDPLEWSQGAGGRILTAAAGFAMTGFFVSELNQRRRRLTSHLSALETQIRLRRDAESQVRILIETSPLAILTIDASGRVLEANESAAQMLGFEGQPLHGAEVTPYLPILPRLVQRHHSGGNMRTSVECKAKRRSGDVFLAHVWFSTYHVSSGPALAAVIWDASENLRDREAAGLDSMLATSRVLIGSLSHEIRNLAAAAANSYAALAEVAGVAGNPQYEALGSLVHALERIASSGLRMASQREAAVADLGTVLDEARIVMEPSLREAGIDVSWEVGENLPLVQADHYSLLQVFVNLARNIESVLQHHPRRQIRIAAGLEGDLVMVRFFDSGPGVAHPDELFRPFQPGADHTGLGLYISRAILLAHGGGLRYEPQPSGSCFAVELWPVENVTKGDGEQSRAHSRVAGG